jgi:glutaredoxin
MFSALRNWLAGSPVQRPDLHFLMYTRAGCHLCTDAWKMLRGYQKRHGFSLEKIDVDTVSDLAARYGNCVPVVAVNGQVRFRGRINEVLLKRLLDRAAVPGGP